MAKHSLLAEISREMPEQCADADGFMFAAYGCAVFEKRLYNGRFEYAALNLASGAKIVLERRRNPITNISIERLIEKLRDSRIAGAGRLEISGETPVPLEKLNTVLNALFREMLPEYGYAIREGQIELAKQMFDTIVSRKILVAEAAVGLGKTLVYIIVGALVKRSKINLNWSGSYFSGMSVAEWQRMPILVSTSSIALQKSVLIYIKEVSKILVENGVIKIPLRICLKKGRRNYVCEHRLLAYLPYERDPGISDALNNILAKGDIDLAEAEGLTQHIKKVVAVPKNCPYETKCRYVSFCETFDETEYDFIVTNHNMLFADVKLRAAGKCGILPPVQMYVIDEAHQLLNAARSIYGVELSAETIPDITKRLATLNFAPYDNGKTRFWRDARDATSILAGQLTSLNAQLFSKSEADFGCDALLRNIRAASGYLQKVLKESHTFNVLRDEQIKNNLIGELRQLSEDADALSENDRQIRWFERGEEDAANLSVCALPKQLNERIYEDLWKRRIPALLTSGTLSAAGDFTAFKRAAGLSKVIRIAKTVQPSPYDYRKNCMIYLSDKVPHPKQSGKAYIDALADEVERLVKSAHGHTAVLFTSYSVMGRVYSKLQKCGLPYHLFK